MAASVGIEAEAVAHQQAVIRCPAQCSAERIGRNNTPIRPTSQACLLIFRELPGQACVRKDRQHAPFQKTEAHGERVIGQQ
ncbi:hypothetical protein D9M69_586840 [compost metagenome]